MQYILHYILTLLCFNVIIVLAKWKTMNTSIENKIQTTIYLPKSIHTELRIRALKEGISMTELIKRAISLELKRTEKT